MTQAGYWANRFQASTGGPGSAVAGSNGKKWTKKTGGDADLG